MPQRYSMIQPIQSKVNEQAQKARVLTGYAMRIKTRRFHESPPTNYMNVLSRQALKSDIVKT